jgi:succinyl-diaminopimelate desuccinylase
MMRMERARAILADLIALPTVNPMGRPYMGTEPVERKALAYIEELFRPYGVQLRRQPAGPIHESLIISCPGRSRDGITLLESHVDTVPAEDWPDRAFTPRVEGTVMYGRGACDDKGSLTAMILAVLSILEDGSLPPYPVVLLAAADEEYAKLGIKTYLRDAPPIRGGVFGEPTGLCPIVRHKGVIRWDITVHGRSAHTSRPELGCNAILEAVPVIQAIQAHHELVQRRYASDVMPAPTITVSMIRGGRAPNAVPDECTLSVDFRVVPGMHTVEARRELIAVLDKLGIRITHAEPQANSPALNAPADDPFSRGVLEICRARTGRPEMEFAAAPYGTDAPWVADRAPVLVLGPGDIASAHAIDEHVDLREVQRCAEIYRDIVLRE